MAKKRQYPSWCYPFKDGSRPCDYGMLCDWCARQTNNDDEKTEKQTARKDGKEFEK